MEGGKATHLHAWARDAGYSFLRFDYSGHGSSDGAFEGGTIGQWCDDAQAVIDAVAPGARVLVGSSMGGWVALLSGVCRTGSQTSGLLLIAPAPDFTERLMWPELLQTNSALRSRKRGGPRVRLPTTPPATSSHVKLFEDGRAHLLLSKPFIPYVGPVRILHGVEDEAVPWVLSLELSEALQSNDVETHFIKAGDHRLSERADLDRLVRTTDALMAQLTSRSA